MFKNLKLRFKIGLGFTLVLVLTILVGGIGFDSLRRVLTASRDVQDASGLVLLIKTARQHEQDFASKGRSESAVQLEKEVKQLLKITDEVLKDEKSTEDADRIKRVVAATQKYRKSFGRFVELDGLKNQKAAAMDEQAKDTLDLIEQLKKDLKTEIGLLKKSAQEVRSQSLWQATAGDKLVQLVTTAQNHGLTYLISNEKESLNKMSEGLREAIAICDELIHKTEDISDLDSTAIVQQAIAKYRSAFNQYNVFRKQSRFLEMAKAWNRLTAETEQIMTAMSEFRDRQMKKYTAKEEEIQQLELDSIQRTNQLDDILAKVQEVRSLDLIYELTGDEASFANIGEILYSITTNLLSVQRKFKSEESKKKTEKISNNIMSFQSILVEYKGYVDEQTAISSELTQNALKVENECMQMQTLQVDSMSEMQSLAYTLIGAGTGLAVLVGLIITFFISNGLTRPIRKAVALAGAIRKGDLSRRLEANSRDETGELALALNEMADTLEKKAELASSIADGDLTARVELASDADTLGAALHQMVGSLNEVLRQVDNAVSQVASGSTQVADSSQSLSQGASEQAASLEEITSSMNEIGSQTNENAHMAAQANQMALGSRKKMEQGVKTMTNMIEAMDEINKSSHQISKIIKTIDDIAFQTNLLALNAAVEAARAGKHGKGFAVVAQEVRNLAGRSAAAAQETEVLIEDSVKKAENGMELVQQTAAALDQIKEANIGVVDLINKIAEASNEQASGLSQINTGLEQVEKVTQSNTANAEQTASASEELSSQAAALKKLLAKFKLNGGAMEESRQLLSSEYGDEEMDNQPRLLAEDEHKEEKRRVNPDELIALDDDDFGKY